MLSADISGKINIIPVSEFGVNPPITHQVESWITGIHYDRKREELLFAYKNQIVENLIIDQDTLAKRLCNKFIDLMNDSVKEYNNDTTAVNGCLEQLTTIGKKDDN